jgi:hypothetical protein
LHSQAASGTDNTAAPGRRWQDILTRLAILALAARWAQWPFFSMDLRDGGPVKPGGPAVA